MSLLLIIYFLHCRTTLPYGPEEGAVMDGLKCSRSVGDGGHVDLINVFLHTASQEI